MPTASPDPLLVTRTQPLLPLPDASPISQPSLTSTTTHTVKPSATQQPASPTVTLTATPKPTYAFTRIGTPLPSLEVISPENAVGLVQVSRWGKGAIKLLQYAPDGNSMAVVTSEGVYFYAADTLELLHFTALPIPDVALALSPSLDRLLIAGPDTDLLVVDTHQGNQILFYQFTDAEGKYFAGAAFLDEVRVIFTPWNNSYGIGEYSWIWDLENNTVLETAYPGADEYRISADYSTIAVSDDGSPNILAWKIVDIKNETPLIQSFHPNEELSSFALSRDGSMVAAGTYYTMQVQIWSYDTGETLHLFSANPYNSYGRGKVLQSPLPSNGYGNFWIGGMDFNPIGGVLAFSTGFEQVLQYDLAQRKIMSFSDSTGEGILYAPDGKQLLSIGDSVVFISPDNGRVKGSLIDHFGGIYDLEFQPRGNLLAFGGTDDKIWLRSNQDGSAVDFLKQPRLSTNESGININWNYIKDLDFSLDGQKIIFGDKDESIWLWDLRNGAQLITYAKDSVTQVAISPDNETIGYIYWDGYLEIMDLSTSELLLTWTYPGDVAFHPSGDFLFISNSGRLLKISPDGQADLFASDGGHLKFSPTGSLLAVGGSYITIYHIDDKSMIWEIPIAKLSSADDGEVTVSALDFSPDEQLLAVSTLSKIYVFGVQSGDLLTVVEGRSTSISFSSDGKLIASGYFDGVVSVWAVPQTP